MATATVILLLLLTATTAVSNPIPLKSVPMSPRRPLISHPTAAGVDSQQPYRAAFKYTRALVLSLPIGTPPQPQPMVLDTGSQLSWVQCNHGRGTTTTTITPGTSNTFDPTLSSSFSSLPCNNSLCQPPTPDFSVPTSCDDRRLCHYSYFYADGSLAEGSLALEALPLFSSRHLLLGCATAAVSDAAGNGSSEGILGMNLGRLSLASQTQISRFSYCVPSSAGVGTFYAGDNPVMAAAGGRVLHARLMRFDKEAAGNGPLPYLDKSAYTVGLNGISLGRAGRLNVSATAFRPDSGGAGQTMVDSGTEFTYFTEEPYEIIKAAVARTVGRRMRRREDVVHAGGLDLCYQARPEFAGVLVGGVALEFEGGAVLAVEGRRAWVHAGGNVTCFSIGSSQLLGMESNIIGNHHQQNYWVEFDLVNSRLGFLRANCSSSMAN